MDIPSVLDWTGEKVSNVSAFAIQKFSELTSKTPSPTISKLISAVILVGLFYVGTKIANKTAKYILIILSLILLVSVGFSLFV